MYSNGLTRVLSVERSDSGKGFDHPPGAPPSDTADRPRISSSPFEDTATRQVGEFSDSTSPHSGTAFSSRCRTSMSFSPPLAVPPPDMLGRQPGLARERTEKEEHSDKENIFFEIIRVRSFGNFVHLSACAGTVRRPHWRSTSRGVANDRYRRCIDVVRDRRLNTPWHGATGLISGQNRDMPLFLPLRWRVEVPLAGAVFCLLPLLTAPTGDIRHHGAIRGRGWRGADELAANNSVSNVTAQLGGTAYLHCLVGHLSERGKTRPDDGHPTVSRAINEIGTDRGLIKNSIMAHGDRVHVRTVNVYFATQSGRVEEDGVLTEQRIRTFQARQVSWIRKRDWHILSSGKFTYTNDERFQVLHGEGSEDWTLQIRFVQKRDNGTYECQLPESMLKKNKGALANLSRPLLLPTTATVLESYSAQKHIVCDTMLKGVTVKSATPDPLLISAKMTKQVKLSVPDINIMVVEESVVRLYHHRSA
ncbi:hypothetical protein EVAR_15767_1 [Eumeta japonica]|uniref:Ig-like domain-containing protein n=1 Tax=Eumeta variegata TaxID=151549 RepID=A0A4C1TZE5_EUMVA|nr:hypothetical protein EVAR_15767_1 [Eumeta japonica]